MNDPSASIPLVQMILSWTLLGVLLVWMFLFALLALYPSKTRKRTDLPTSPGAFSEIVPQTPLHRATVSVDVSLNGTPATVSKPAGDVGAARVV